MRRSFHLGSCAFLHYTGLSLFAISFVLICRGIGPYQRSFSRYVYPLPDPNGISPASISANAREREMPRIAAT